MIRIQVSAVVVSASLVLSLIEAPVVGFFILKGDASVSHVKIILLFLYSSVPIQRALFSQGKAESRFNLARLYCNFWLSQGTVPLVPHDCTKQNLSMEVMFKVYKYQS